MIEQNNDKVNRNRRSTNLDNVPPKFAWDDMSSTRFRDALEQEDVRRDIQNMLSNDTVDCNKDLETFTDIIYKTAHKSLRKKRIYHGNNKKRTKKKKWFNQDLDSKRRDLRLVAKDLGKNPWDRELRNRVNTMRISFNKSVKKAKKDYTNMLINKLENMHDKDPKQYWALVEELKNDDISKESSSKTPFNENEWNAYFKNLYGKNDNLNWDNTIQNQLSELERNTSINENLNIRITETEIKKRSYEIKEQ